MLACLTQRHLGAARDELERWQTWHDRLNDHLGPDHPDTLTARVDLAAWTGRAGDAAADRDMYAALLPTRERVSGPEHPNTLTARANLAWYTRQAGDLNASR